MVKPSHMTIAAILLGALLLCGGAAVAQHDDQGTDRAEHGQVADSHDEDSQGETAEGHGEETDSDAAHGEEAHGEEAHGDEAHGEAHSDIPHLPSFLIWIADFIGEGAVSDFLHDFQDPIFSLIVTALLAIFFARVHAGLDPRNPTRLQMAVEIVLGGLYSLFESIIGPTARRYTPYLGTLFLFIVTNNLIGMLPLSHSSTTSFQSTTLALGLCTFFYVQGIAIKENGIGGYLHHLAGSPKSGVEWALTPLFFPLHTIGELIKPISLSLRLFGNIFGEHTLSATMVILGYIIVKALAGDYAFIGVPLQFPFYFLGLLGSTIQALVFTMLSTVYIALMLPHDDHGHGDLGHEEAHGH
jgi:F-type H+-transporting ATPase subunit a